MLEVWGASSGLSLVSNTTNNSYCGKGGFSYGCYQMSVNQAIYVSVGGKGQDGTYQSRTKGGWNGGGDGEWDHSDDEFMAAGGGCTSIQKSLKGDGQLKNYESVKNTDVLIVAGGGGGGYSVYYSIDNSQYAGGDIGSKTGYITSANNMTYGNQATQTSGYAFGIGQSASYDYNKYKNCDVAGAGGGWYGGYTISPTSSDIWSWAGGGSGHIGSMLTDGFMKAGNESMPSTSGGTETGHSGNGYCKITWHPSL